jgi:glycosyltransferase involved in cell wall biosynthesis
MKIIWFTWKDRTHPFAGGAEVVTNEICKRLVLDGHEVIMITAGYGDCVKEEFLDGYKVIRVGSKFSVYIKAYQYFIRNLNKWPDLLVEEINIFPFFTQFYAKKVKKRILFMHQTGRMVWFYQLLFPLSLIGYIIEPVYLWFLRRSAVITVSHSTKNDLVRHGFKEANITIVQQGNNIAPIKEIDLDKKYSTLTLLSLGEIRPMKRTLHVLYAFEHLKRTMPQLRLIVAGGVNTRYGQKFLKRVKRSPYVHDITVLGRVSHAKKMKLMKKSHVVVMTSVREGWGLVVTESNSLGTPAVVYDVHGLRDSVKSGHTGIICEKNTPIYLARMIDLLLSDDRKYHIMQRNAWKYSKKHTFDKCYQDFINACKI